MIKNLEKYTQEFYGYGNINSDFWFIGHEEGSKQNSIKELEERINTWLKLGETTLCDCRDFHLKLKMRNETPFTKGSPQPTWDAYIQILNQSKNLNLNNTQDKKIFKLYKFARLNSNHALLELFPIPCSKIISWNYSELSNEIEYFSSKETYRNTVVKFRLEKIKNLINKKKPKIIIFNGIGLNKYPTLVYWQEIIGDVPKEIIVGKKRFFFLCKNQINYFIIPQLIHTTNEVIFTVTKKIIENLK